MTEPCILGVDPGVTGGIAFFFPSNPRGITAEDIPTVAGEVDTDTLARRIRQMAPTMAIIERVGAMPKQGVSSTFKFGFAAGALNATLSVLGIERHLIVPAKWKRHYGLPAEKEAARLRAIMLWPGAGCFARKKDHGRAEAALIARYGAEIILPSRWDVLMGDAA